MNALQWEIIMNVNIRCGVNGIRNSDSDDDDDDDDDAGNLVQVWPICTLMKWKCRVGSPSIATQYARRNMCMRAHNTLEASSVIW